MLVPRSDAAASIAWLTWFLIFVCGAVFAVTMLLAAIAVLSRRRNPRHESPVGRRFIVFSGVILPAVILFVILFVSVQGQVSLSRPEANLTVRVIGHLWWWEVHYPQQQIVTANEIYIPVGEPVHLELSSADVIHSFWVPNLNGKTDLLPGQVNHTWLAADRPGEYRGQCAEYCGMQHALMGLRVVAVPPKEFAAWVNDRQSPPPAADPELPIRGQQVFTEAGCSSCHSIRGTPAKNQRGPDLTHIGSRLTLGAGTVRNNRGNLAGWIANPQLIKPGILMPPTPLAPAELHALVDYLESLK